MNAKEIIEAIKKANITVDEFAYGDFDSKDVPGLGEFKKVDQHGGEGQGEKWWSVKYFKDHDVYIKTNGFYTSYNGTDFEDGYGEEVRPVEKTITIFE